MDGDQRVALVTGAASGIGLAIATSFVKQGYFTLMLDQSSELNATAGRLGGKAEAMVVDVARQDQIASAMQAVQKRHGRCDILVNNAGIHPKREGGKFTIEQITHEQWQEVIAINLTAPFLFTQLALPLMRARRWGRIVNISSRGGRTVSPVASAHYSATKSGLIGFRRTTALEAAADNITEHHGNLLHARTVEERDHGGLLPRGDRRLHQGHPPGTLRRCGRSRRRVNISAFEV